MHSLVLALVLMGLPRVHPGPSGVIADGPRVPATAAAIEPWLTRASGLPVRPDTQWAARVIPLGHGGRLVLLRERYRGHFIAGARLALRVGPGGRLRQVIGTGLSPGGLPAQLERAPGEPWPDRATLWWPTTEGLVPVRVEDTKLSLFEGWPRQDRRYIDAQTGAVLGTESLIDEFEVPIWGWPENPLTTPELVEFNVTLEDLERDTIVLQDEVFKVVDCNWSEVEQTCDPIFSPTATSPDGFPSNPPPLADAAGHAAWDDPYAALQVMQFAARTEAKLAQWGWDPYAWDELDCDWQQLEDPADCRVWIHTNVLAQDDEGVFPFAGGFYNRTGKIFLGQGFHADTAYDGDIVVHEIGHHITWSFGSPIDTGLGTDVSRLFTDFSALSESSSDFLARMLGPNDWIYDYFSTVEPGRYFGPRIRDVSIPFRCPENVVGESHMDGRIWISAVIDGLVALEAAGLADRDAYAVTYYGALAAIRQIPREQKLQLPDARAILLDEVELSFGSQAHDLVRDIFDARGVGACEHLIDLRDEPTITGRGDPLDNPLDARFLVLRSHLPSADPEVVDAHPYAPPVQHRITLGPDEGGVALTYRPGRWAPKRPEDALDVSFDTAALVKPGDQLVQFSLGDTGLIVHDATLRFDSQADGELERVIIDGLEPGQTYTIALVSRSQIYGDKFMVEDMRWELLEAADGGSEGADESGSESGSGSGSGGIDDAEGGCACTTTDRRPGPWLALVVLVAVRRRRSDARA